MQSPRARTRSSSAGAATRERILRAAEELFAVHGPEEVSFRQVTEKAGANVAAINYHFGTKEALISEIFARHAGTISRERIDRLQNCREEPGRPPLLEQIVEAFLRPAFAVAKKPGGISFMHLRARLSHNRDDFTRRLFYDHFDSVTKQFIQAIADCVPHLDKEELYWRFHFFLGSYIYTMSNPGRIQVLSDGLCDPGDIDMALSHLIRHACASFRMPMR